jgi:hypothetical protein
MVTIEHNFEIEFEGEFYSGILIIDAVVEEDQMLYENNTRYIRTVKIIGAELFEVTPTPSKPRTLNNLIETILSVDEEEIESRILQEWYNDDANC